MVEEISICICTYRRADLLGQLLKRLPEQQTNGLFTFSVVVVDNDREESAREVTTAFAENAPFVVLYRVEPRQNIALARNLAVANANGSYVAFIDDDEFPEPNWLIDHFKACRQYGADGSLGPVLPYYETPPPAWLANGGFHNRPRHSTGYEITLKDARTGNALLKREVLLRDGDPFQSQFENGGEDVDFFRRRMEKGSKFIWCDEAVVHEVVPQVRCTRAYFTKRALLRGANSLKQQRGRWAKVGKSAIALPLYALSLPFLRLAGDHHYFKYLIKTCDHAGRLLATIGIRPVRERIG
jgi:succinoglycan biosynthesis protein ExoM